MISNNLAIIIQTINLVFFACQELFLWYNEKVVKHFRKYVASHFLYA